MKKILVCVEQGCGGGYCTSEEVQQPVHEKAQGWKICSVCVCVEVESVQTAECAVCLQVVVLVNKQDVCCCLPFSVSLDLVEEAHEEMVGVC